VAITLQNFLDQPLRVVIWNLKNWLFSFGTPYSKGFL